MNIVMSALSSSVTARVSAEREELKKATLTRKPRLHSSQKRALLKTGMRARYPSVAPNLGRPVFALHDALIWRQLRSSQVHPTCIGRPGLLLKTTNPPHVMRFADTSPTRTTGAAQPTKYIELLEEENLARED